ncbi:DUF4286 family protein [Agrococcus sp. ARC_14]|uniref:DUF4286 family protein n=1 Tax=Agrococcus sp. ARC_14 TaxID=2919927 RepID=UPI001F055D63|nr:DUF4286 family protein [Agrococcus sp. ARC_14]MCH1881402.1 hypothetical protein [Agrococcus sp. ARC_14]
MLHLGTGQLLWMLQPDDTVEDEWNEWYDTEHVAALMRVPGFLNGARYRLERTLAGVTPPRYLASYELDDLDVLESESYRSNRSSLGEGMRRHWTQRMLGEVTYAAGGMYHVRDAWQRPATQPVLPAPRLLLIGLASGAAQESWLDEHLPSLRAQAGVRGYRSLALAAGSPRIAGMRDRAEAAQLLIVCALDAESDPQEPLVALCADRTASEVTAASYLPIFAAFGQAATTPSAP